MAWEKGELFPTKQFIDRDGGLPREGARRDPEEGERERPDEAARDPVVWELVRKLLVHKKLRDEVAKLAAGYPDPGEE